MTFNTLQIGICLFLSFSSKGVMSIPDVNGVKLTIEPKVVRRFQFATLRCLYDTEESALYAVKWYRGSNEFYRYEPKEEPKTKVFPYQGIVVDENNSNSTQVVLRDIDFNIAGNFTCEITKDITFSTLSDTQTMSVVHLPEFPPTISVDGEPLDCGDTLRANCTSQPARPPARLTLILNGLVVAKSDPLTFRQTQEMAWSDLSLEVLLTEFYFAQGRLILQCKAEIDDIYREEATLQLASVRNPVHERVSAVGAANVSKRTLLLSFISLCCPILLSFKIQRILRNLVNKDTSPNFHSGEASSVSSSLMTPQCMQYSCIGSNTGSDKEEQKHHRLYAEGN
ncbi:hypothetical protein WA026_011351 [Henosepilachna vigintioctopunctata]|uniref:Ig-like domain-containing protein n=1 Tax=Henosepilachna vigintioctopunctata TaxID=420089 RepID=A0AAW1TTF0_9CUCU